MRQKRVGSARGSKAQIRSVINWALDIYFIVYQSIYGVSPRDERSIELDLIFFFI